VPLRLDATIDWRTENGYILSVHGGISGTFKNHLKAELLRELIHSHYLTQHISGAIPMKKHMLLVVVLLVALVLVSTVSFAQAKKGDNLISAGVGFGYPGYYGASGMPPIFAMWEHCIYPKITVGPMASYATSSFTTGIVQGKEEKWTYTYIFIGARGAYHFAEDLMKDNKNVDLYGGLSFGYNIVNNDYSGPAQQYAGLYSVGASYVHFGFFAGGRYFFSPKFAALGEIGYDIGYFKIGLTYKL